VADGGRLETAPTPQAFWTTFVLIFVAIALIFSFDTFLAGVDQRESRSEAANLFEEGKRLAAQGDYREAIDRFRTATFTNRGNRDYQLALADALLAAGKYSDAETQLADVLQRNATWGPANLAMARTLVDERRFAEATSYYHRAIYGQWETDAADNRVRTRFELIDLLVQQHSRQDLLAELLPLLDEAPDSLPLRKRLGHLFVVAGSPTRATTIFQDILRHSPDDADAHAGLGEAAFARGNYRTARSWLLTAVRLAPDDSTIQKRLALVDEVLSLDPTQRGLGTAEQYRRSRTLLELASQELEQCARPPEGSVARLTVDSAKALLARTVRQARQREAYEANLDLAEQVWQTRQSACAIPAAQDDPVTLVLARLAQ